MSLFVDDPSRLGTTLLSDGRVLGWAEWGPEDGLPVLLSPGAGTSRWLGIGSGAVETEGVRLVSVDRPGLGVSTPAPDRDFADFVADVRELTEVRGLGPCPAMLGNSQGAPFALACAAAGAVSALALVSPADEVAAPEFADALPDELRGLVARVAEDPVGAEKVFAGFDADAMRRMVLAGSPASDLTVYEDPGFAAAYGRALEEGFTQGAGAGYARDTVLAMSRWPIDLGAITVPVEVWFGEEDTSHSPDLGLRLVSRIPGARRTVVPGVGGALLWAAAEPILASLAETVRPDEPEERDWREEWARREERGRRERPGAGRP
ncbi:MULTISPECIES: alpha/beta fold hydrolase [Streptomyces]|uniref:alpha/beta fold hydrolase n=1 Tax=Streptomyces TaxID=1883 RepID=UPI00068B4F15|nr:MULTISPECIES: alpha/beta fold hydrolase [Streptomyces]MDP9951176.1 pimeloyl-ACP methyl ester carboxylesterase [Streptomyces sp. DSM 41269]